MTAHDIVGILLGGKMSESEIDPHEFVVGYVDAWRKRLSTPGSFSVQSSHGHFTVDQDGKVLTSFVNDNDPESAWILNVTSFNVDEWRDYWRKDPVKKEFLDILDIGFWENDGNYTPPEMDWRCERRADMANYEHP